MPNAPSERSLHPASALFELASHLRQLVLPGLLVLIAGARGSDAWQVYAMVFFVPIALASVARTRRCLVVHEDLRTAGFGAEVVATVADEAFLSLDAPVARLTMPDIPSPHNAVLLDAVVPSVARIRAKIDALLEF